MSRFDVVYTTPWPTALKNMWIWLAFMRLDWLKLPGLNCFAKNYDYYASLKISTALPLLVAFLLWMPSLIMTVMGQRETDKFDHVSNSFYFSLMFLCFLVNPGPPPWPPAAVLTSATRTCRLSCQCVRSPLQSNPLRMAAGLSLSQCDVSPR